MAQPNGYFISQLILEQVFELIREEVTHKKAEYMLAALRTLRPVNLEAAPPKVPNKEIPVETNNDSKKE